MLIACWSAQGGAGTTTVAAALSLLYAPSSPTGALLADLTGDAPAVLGLADADQPGLAGWLAQDGTAATLHQLEVETPSGLSLLPRGSGPLHAHRAPELAGLLEHSHRPVVADCGNLAPGRGCRLSHGLARAASCSLLVIRPTYVGLRNAANSDLRPSGVIMIIAPGRGFGRADVERATGARVLTQIPDDPAVGRATDAGLLTGRLPTALAESLTRIL